MPLRLTHWVLEDQPLREEHSSRARNVLISNEICVVIFQKNFFFFFFLGGTPNIFTGRVTSWETDTHTRLDTDSSGFVIVNKLCWASFCKSAIRDRYEWLSESDTWIGVLFFVFFLGGSHQCTPGLLRRHLSSYSTSACLSSRCCCFTLTRKQSTVMSRSLVKHSKSASTHKCAW